ncbi:FAD-dependent oxidoreductase [Nannocystis pusilla]|uniref:FAD-dependent oxidoreductase n=1 Tax=Nannocystis pusilla TaxID=889268 RepID=A0A9X3J019_9BACT|nr:FAD-dependent oxidoreductase [Nannocystis pusilla]
MPRPLDVLVVGGGIAGLAAATILSERGARVTVLEPETFLGGRAGAWTDTLADGTRFEMERGFHAFFRQYYCARLAAAHRPGARLPAPRRRLPAARPRRPARVVRRPAEAADLEPRQPDPPQQHHDLARRPARRRHLRARHHGLRPARHLRPVRPRGREELPRPPRLPAARGRCCSMCSPTPSSTRSRSSAPPSC